MTLSVKTGVVRIAALLAWGWCGAGAAPAEPTSVEVVFNTPAQFAGCYRDGAIDVTTAPGQARLVPMDCRPQDWTGYRVSKDCFSTQYWGRKQFVLDQPVAGPVKIFVFHGTGTATLNGQAVAFRNIERVGWSVAEVAGAALRAGKNDLLFTAGFNLAYDRDGSSPQNSQVSRDGGKTWLAAPGEYLVHLLLPRHAPAGTLTSPVIDLANPRNENRICPLLEAQSLKVEAATDTPPGTSVDLQVRTGATLQPDAQWSAWLPPQKARPARFLQWRAGLRSTQPEATPALKSVHISAGVSVQADSLPPGLTIREFQNETIVRGSYPFSFQTPSPKLARLRAEWRLDEIVAPGKTELEKFLLLRNWARRQWPANEGNCQRPWDALNILAAPAGDHGMCVHFAVVFAQCAQALGYNARQIILFNHYVADIWSHEHGKWVVMDVEAVQAEATGRYGTALYWDSKTQAPMSAWDIHRVVWRERDPGRIIQKLVLQSADGRAETVDRRYPESEYHNFIRIAALARNNYLDQSEPWEIAHGFDYFHCDEYLWWRDDAAPIAGEYSRHTDREGDVLWTVNQAALTLTATAQPDRVTVQADTVTPNFKEFAYRFNGGEWRREPGTGQDPHSRQAAWEWPLAVGANTLEIKTLNLFEREGRLSRVVLVRAEKTK